MHNLRELRGTYKGLIGECMFKLTRKYAVLPKFFNKEKYFQIFGEYLNSEQSDFIAANWFSIDAIEISFENGAKDITLFEIKTKNVYMKRLFFKPKMTMAAHMLYNKARDIGFDVKIATVHFHYNWDYHIELSEFDKSNYCIDKPKPYDRAGYG